MARKQKDRSALLFSRQSCLNWGKQTGSVGLVSHGSFVRLLSVTRKSKLVRMERVRVNLGVEGADIMCSTLFQVKRKGLISIVKT